MAPPVVRVVLRVDPLLQLDSLTIHQNNITLGTHQFTFDKIHPQNHTPNDIYQANLEPLLEPYIQGTNVTVLIYGDSQPSSELDPREEQDDQGIIRRFSQALFNHLEETISSASVHVSYAKLENNNANPVDLLHASAPTSGITDEWVMDTDELMSLFTPTKRIKMEYNPYSRIIFWTGAIRRYPGPYGTQNNDNDNDNYNGGWVRCQ
ncbi:hypothetical protein F4703DRAFT_1877138 [Phycomyces blakesleeanus]